MEKTGESYTTARAHFRPPSPAAASAIEEFRARVLQRSSLDRLGPHLESTYGIRVAKLTELDLGVYRVARSDGPSWVAKVFPACRPIEAAAGDAAVLEHVASSGLVAERGAHPDP